VPIARYTPVDGWLAIGLVGFVAAKYWLLGSYYATISATSPSGLPSGPGEALRLGLGALGAAVTVAVLAALLRFRGHSWDTVGLSRQNMQQSTRAGLLLSLLLITSVWLIGRWNSTPPDFNLTMITFGVPFYLGVIGFTEEIVFRGYLTTRLAGIGRRRVGVVAAGLIFGLSHLPFQLAQTTLPLGTFLAQIWPNLVIPFCWHFVFWALYKRWNNLAAPVLFHFALNWSNYLL
jgi:membrane protease YdiL (CAAX protease family)